MDSVDPTQFLAQEIEDEMDNNKHPQILASLGLTHISQVSVNFELSNFDRLILNFNFFPFLKTIAKYRQQQQ